MSKKKIENKEFLNKDENTQAIVIADDFNENFIPLSDDLSLALIPLVNVPLLDYTLEYLFLAGVNETILFCCKHIDKIRNYISDKIKSHCSWSFSMQVHVIASEGCHSLGDALRDIDAKGLIRSDFILLNVNSIFNVKLSSVLQKHKKICKQDKNCSITLLLKETEPDSATRFPLNDIVLISDSQSSKVLFYQKLKNNLSKIAIPLENFLNNDIVDIHYDLHDSEIAICSQSILPLFTDNFDFQTIGDLIKGLLNDEILTNTIYWHKLTEDYALSVNNWYMFHQVSHDIIHRWAFPLVPEMDISGQKQIYSFLRNHIYKNKTVKLSKGSLLVEDIVIGSDSSLGENTIVDKTIIGFNCKIGKNCKLNNCHVMDGSVIGNDCEISYSIIGPNCVIGNKVQLKNNCVLSQNVHISNNAHLNDVLLQSEKPQNCSSTDYINERAYKVPNIIIDEDSNLTGILNTISCLNFDENELGDDGSIISSSLYSDQSNLSRPASTIPDDTNMFLTEVLDSLSRGYDDKLPCDNLILEINSSRYAYNVTLKEVNYNVIRALLTLPLELNQDSQYLQLVFSVLKYFKPIVDNYVKNESSMEDCLQALQDVCSSTEDLLKCVTKVLHWFYDQEILSEDAILGWYSKLNEDNKIRENLAPFINWLQQADEESDESNE